MTVGITRGPVLGSCPTRAFAKGFGPQAEAGAGRALTREGPAARTTSVMAGREGGSPWGRREDSCNDRKEPIGRTADLLVPREADGNRGRSVAALKAAAPAAALEIDPPIGEDIETLLLIRGLVRGTR